MKRILLILATFIIFQNQTSVFAAKGVITDCVAKTGAFLVKDKKRSRPKPIELKEGDTFWGYFTCSSCGTDPVSLKPQKDGIQGCVNCGNPWEKKLEPYRRPSLFKKAGRLYLVDTHQLATEPHELVRATTTYIDKNGDRTGEWSCPFCSVSNFVADAQCTSCGAHWENKRETSYLLADFGQNKSQAGRKNNSNNKSVAGREGNLKIKGKVGREGNSNRDSVVGREGNLKIKGKVGREGNSNRDSVAGRETSISFRDRLKPRPLNEIEIKKVAAGVLTVVAFGVTYWGGTTSQVEGEFRGFNSAGDPIIFYTIGGVTFRAELDAGGDTASQVKWKEGDTVTLYFSNWQHAVRDKMGVERGNGEVYKANKIDD